MMTTAKKAAPAISIRDLVKAYPTFRLGPLSLTLEVGRVLAVVGPNGAGKTTLLNCTVGLCRSDSGSVAILGMANDPNRTDWKHVIGYVGEHHGFYQNWTGRANLEFLAEFYRSWCMENCCVMARQLDLPLDKPVRTLSKGNRAKLALVSAVGHRPRLLLLDEPFSSLDPLVRSQVHDYLRQLQNDGELAVMYSTHIISDVERLADEVVFLQRGNIQWRADTCALADSWRRITFFAAAPIGNLPAVVHQQQEGHAYRLLSRDANATLRALRTQGVSDAEVSRLTLEEIAIEIMKGDRDVASA